MADNLNVYQFDREVALTEEELAAEAKRKVPSVSSVTKDSIQALAGWLAGRFVLAGSEDGKVYAVTEERRSAIGFLPATWRC